MLPAKITEEQNSDSQPMVHNLICGGLQILLSISYIKYTFPSTIRKIAIVNKTTNSFHHWLYFSLVYFDPEHNTWFWLVTESKFPIYFIFLFQIYLFLSEDQVIK
jgi:hypothetical protein